MSDKTINHNPATDYVCPNCNAEVGAPCTDDTGRPWKLSHASRGAPRAALGPVELACWSGSIEDVEALIQIAHELEREGREAAKTGASVPTPSPAATFILAESNNV